MIRKLTAALRLMRIEQWVKNVFVFLPLFFSGNLFNGRYYPLILFVFLSFSLVASAIYCLNDIADVERDRKHPKKRHRPIASGDISRGGALFVMGLCLVGSLALSMLCGPNRLWLTAIILGYFLLNVAYTFKIKQFAIIDVFVLALGFVFRVFAGGISCDIYTSHWLVLMTFLLSLFLAFAKRRDDYIIFAQTGVEARKGIRKYNQDFLDQILGLLGSVTLVCYILYTVSDEVTANFHTRYVYLTAIWVLAAIIKYMQLTIVEGKSGSPTKVLLTNRFVQCCVAAWILHFCAIIYLNPFHGLS